MLALSSSASEANKRDGTMSDTSASVDSIESREEQGAPKEIGTSQEKVEGP